MATYYVRADGTAANKAAATSDAAAATAMSLATHNAETFAAGDTIYVSDKGGEYVNNATNKLQIPTSGASGNVVSYTAIGYPVISGDATYALQVVIKAYLTFTGITFTTKWVYFQAGTNIILNKCVFKNGTDTNGMIFANTASTITMNNCAVHGNAGNGIYVGTTGQTFTMRNCLFYGNVKSAISTVNTNTIDYDYCLFTGNNSTLALNLSLGTGAVDGGHNLVESLPGIRSYKNNTAYFVFTVDEAASAPYTAYMMSVADAVEPHGVRITVYPQINPLDAADGLNLLALHNRGHEIGVHTWTHTRMTRTDNFAITTTNANPTVNIDTAGSQIILATTTGGNSVTLPWTGDKRISDLQTAVAGKGWTITPSTGISTEMFLSSSKDTVGAQAVPYTVLLDRSAPNYMFFYNEVDKVRDYLAAITGAAPTTYAFPENAWDANAEAYLLAQGISGARASGLATLSSLDIYNVATTSLTTVKGDGTEATIRKLARHYAIWAKNNGYIIVFLAHDATEFTAQQWGWLASEIRNSGNEIIKFSNAIAKIKADHSTADNIIYTKTYPDISDYRIQYGTAAIDNGVAIAGLTTDFYGNPIPSGAAPDIGINELDIPLALRRRTNSSQKMQLTALGRT